MTNSAKHRSWTANLSFRPATAALALAIVFALAALAQSAHAQTFTVLHNFANGADGGEPEAGLSMDRAGNLYGTASTGGNSSGACNPHGCGTVFKLSRKGSGWVFTPIYTFSEPDGAKPQARVIFGPDGSLYGTTAFGGAADQGTVFSLRPPATACKSALCPWTETVLYAFKGGVDDGFDPGLGDLLFDPPGNIYGTTISGGGNDGGVVYQLTPSGSGWTESLLHSFGEGSDGAAPYAGLIFDKDGNLYGTLADGGPSDAGMVFQLAHATGWTEDILYTFQGQLDGGNPVASLIFDQSGNLYGATIDSGNGSGTVFELSPSGSGWKFTVLYSFTGLSGPFGTLVMDAAGNLFGTTLGDGSHNAGSIFKLTPSSPYWTYISLHDFTGGNDGANPYGNVIFDAGGNLYGTASSGGAQGYGTVWEITP